MGPDENFTWENPFLWTKKGKFAIIDNAEKGQQYLESEFDATLV